MHTGAQTNKQTNKARIHLEIHEQVHNIKMKAFLNAQDLNERETFHKKGVSNRSVRLHFESDGRTRSSTAPCCPLEDSNEPTEASRRSRDSRIND